ncbi:MAG TPA: LrgB family protein [Marmoricola sp.]|nr:LrgB family protein [Marmoricola sp.]
MNVVEAWDAVRSSPVFAVALTLAAYRAGTWLRGRSGGSAWVNPVLVAIVVVGTTLWAVDVDYGTYLEGGSIIAIFLGPATVALAWPLHLELRLVRRSAGPLLSAIVVGSGVAVVVAVVVTRSLGGDELLARSMAPKSTTTPVAIALSETVAGVPALTAVLTILTGILGAVAGPRLLTLLRVRDERVRGLAVGVSAHGIGTAQMLQESRTAGAFSGLAMALSALASSVWVPLLVPRLT